MVRLFYKYKATHRKYVARKRGQIKVTGWVLFLTFYVVVGPLFFARMYSVSHLYAVKPLSKWMASLTWHSMLCFILGGSLVSMPLPITCPEIQSFELFWHFQHCNLMFFCLELYLKQQCWNCHIKLVFDNKRIYPRLPPKLKYRIMSEEAEAHNQLFS